MLAIAAMFARNLFSRERPILRILCSLGQELDQETKRLTGHLTGLSDGKKIAIRLESCQKQRRGSFDCGLHVIAMAVVFRQTLPYVIPFCVYGGKEILSGGTEIPQKEVWKKSH